VQIRKLAAGRHFDLWYRPTVSLEAPREGLCESPNAEAPPNRIDLFPGLVLVDGYQQYALTRHDIRCGPRHPATRTKARLLADWMTPRFLKGRTVLDLGGNAGFHSLWALQGGAERATVVDIDGEALQNGRKAAAHVGLTAFDVAQSNIAEWTEPADVVLALALVHWAYSCTALFGSVTAFVERVASLARYLALLEWVAPDDPLISRCGHTRWNPGGVTGPYEEKEFLDALDRSFASTRVIGEVSPTRHLYAAFHVKGEIDLSSPLELLLPLESLAASRNVSRFRGADHWSRVYRGPGPDRITKQTSFDIAHHEFVLLKRLSGPYFPRAFQESAAGASSSLVVEAIDGKALSEASDHVTANAGAFGAFVTHCLNILRALRDAGIQHRDIRGENVLIRERVPMLVDFGWAIADDLPQVTPLYLGLDGRPSDGSFCDVYSMGTLLSSLKGERFSQWDPMLRLMAEPDGRCRLTDLDALKLLADAAASRAGSARGGDMDETKQALSQLADKAAALSQRASGQESRILELEQELLRRQESIEALSARLFSAESLGEERWRVTFDKKEADIAELRAALEEKDRQIAALSNVARELHAAQIALAESRGAQAVQANHVAYLEKEIQTPFWRKVVAYVRHKIGGA
jgi:hypothetical protein